VYVHTFDAAGVSIDSRTLAAGELFVALHSESGDGHAHVAAALAAGAAGALIDRDLGDGPYLLVDDTQAALARLGAFARARFLGRVAAVTGSVGKTTTKEMLRLALASQGATHAAVASYNNHWGVPLTLARLPPEARFCVAEIGMNHPGEIAPLARLVRPHVAVITNIEPAHLGNMGSIEAIADEKAAIMQGLGSDGVAVLPADSPHAGRLLRHAQAAGLSVLTHGASAGSDARLIEAVTDADGSDVVIGVGNLEHRFRLPAAGRHMALCATAALAAVYALGADVALAARALGQFNPLGGRGARRAIRVAGGEALLLDESYNASPVAVRAALAVLSLQPATRRLAILGDMLELGAESDAIHAGLASDVLASADLLFACGPSMRVLHDSLPAAKRGAYAPDSQSLVAAVLAALRPGDAVLVKGSLGSRMKTIVTALESQMGGKA
jgi:UDP-N-acetylmuramoyl-tripeptide--D-alanyl-D-alanine ligase